MSNESKTSPSAASADEFLDEATTPENEAFTSTAELMNAARQWVDAREGYRFGSRALAEAMRRRGGQKHSNGMRRGWKGVRLR